MPDLIEAFDALADAHWQVWWSVIRRIDPEAEAYANGKQLKDDGGPSASESFDGEMPQAIYPE
jgi:hypothetical protein